MNSMGYRESRRSSGISNFTRTLTQPWASQKEAQWARDRSLPSPRMPSSDTDDFEHIESIQSEALAPLDIPATSLTKDEPHYLILVSSLQKAVDGRPNGPIFHSQLKLGSTKLYDTYLQGLSEDHRAEYNCKACRHFINLFGDLCVVRDDGSLHPLLWSQDLTTDDVPSRYHNALKAINQLFVGACVGEQYHITKDDERSLGRKHTRNSLWTHFHVTLHGAPNSVQVNGLDTRTAFDMLSRILSDNNLQTINQTHHLLHEKLSYSTSHKPAINWLKDVATKVDALEGGEIQKRNLITRFASSAWAGCLSSLRGGIIGMLLADVAEGLEFSVVNDKWTRRADPHHYMRPTAAPAPGNIVTAEKAFASVGYTKDDLARYYMTVDQIPEAGVLWKDEKLWNAVSPLPASEGIFSSLKASLEAKKSAGGSSANAAGDDNAQPTPISFRNFTRRVLPHAESLELDLAESQTLAFFTVGAPGTKSPFAWGSETNTAAWYYWDNDLPVEMGSLKPGWTEVSAITSFPHMWEYMTAKEALDYEESTTHNASGGGMPAADKNPLWIHYRHGVQYLFCLKDAKDTDIQSLCLFPTCLKNDFHAVRKTVEAFSAAGKMQQPIQRDSEGRKELQHVGGIAASQGSLDWPTLVVRVRTDQGIRTQYKITLYD